MKIKITAAVIALMLAPSFAMAQCMDKADVTAASCQQGHVWDEAKGTCVLSPTT
ncbi:MAG: hypothetical protein MUF74_11430 [Cypionkella sp.]|jgi:hypothetical protein|nr:hypothetical protein [Cypionkella sp.]